MLKLLTIGTYDGVHRGHRKIISAVLRDSRKLALKPSVVYFPAPPKFFFSKQAENCLITLPEERERLIQQTGAVCVRALPFTAELSRMAAERFFSGILTGSLGAGGLCVGRDFALGRERRGNVDFLRKACADSGLFFRAMSFVRHGSHKISSSLIRAFLHCGNVEEANVCLGWNYSVSGCVVKGAGMGRKLGFPTANIAAHPAKILPPGIFAAHVKLGADTFEAVLNVGRRPTLDTLGSRMILEAHILDFSKMIYGRKLEVVFLKHLRPERKFHSRESLIHHIQEDIVNARRFFSSKVTQVQV
ncbi:MAG TPA: riboflavin biosynthesis protein RibF [Elusimicrobia bacterium]|nr:riboflavin biosynthesis protein RibF [Elusimicrobiota bacterium]